MIGSRIQYQKKSRERVESSTASTPLYVFDVRGLAAYRPGHIGSRATNTKNQPEILSRRALMFLTENYSLLSQTASVAQRNKAKSV
jgi:hypothetical protein